ncbi:hypothetical protein [Streptomyces liangshanensis]|uniref:Uncharacterized protein n=1 Tax=Streptomyces liangshanensis TaxID=2717324 RepID=A0A6G9H8C9_9ACTN|nr:hypothetical protein [Streptomyces liangshanensis]QIQ06509.1 hypothetical protein HA039_33100 [Streptomyces liangshanensis]
MVISGAGTEAGTAVLLAAAPAGKGRLVDAASVLPALATVAPGTLTGTSTATVIELADPLDPQTVLTRIRAAATTAGPLFLYIAGQLQLDHKQNLFHLALARTSPATLRYTGLPWHWLTGELKLRRPGTTTVVVDLVADAEAWRQVTTEGIGLGHGTRLYGRVVPAPPRRKVLTPAYLAACAAIWRSGMRPTLPHLHEQATSRSTTPEALFLSLDPAPVPTPPDPAGTARPAPTDRTGDPGATIVPAAPAASGGSARSASAGRSRSQGSATRPAGHEASAAPGTPALPAGYTSTAPAPPPPAARSAPVRRAPAKSNRPLAWGPAEPKPVPPENRPAGEADPHPAILAAAREGRHAEAASIAATWESAALRTYGPGSAQAIHWLEVRADLARLAEDAARSCELWMAAAQARLARGEAADDKDVEASVDRAHHQWEQLDDPVRARSLAPALTALRRAVPGRKDGALQAIQRRI